MRADGAPRTCAPSRRRHVRDERGSSRRPCAGEGDARAWIDRRFEAVVIGAGPAGSSLALRLSRAGMRVALVDRRVFPRFKPCGEFLSPECLPMLAELGVAGELERLGARGVLGLRLHGHGRTVEAAFRPVGRAQVPFGRGLALRRDRLDHALLRAAAATGGVELFEGWSFVDLLRGAAGEVLGARIRSREGRILDLRAAFTVGADGVRSEVARRLGVRRPIGWIDKLALTTRYAGVPLDGFAEVHFFDGGYFAACAVDEDLFSLNLVVDRGRLRAEGASAEGFLERAVLRCSLLREKLARAERVDPVRGTGPLAFHTSRQTFDGAALLGDACGYVDPVTGEGIYFALRGAQLLAESLVDARSSGRTDRAALGPYARLRLREIAPRAWLGLALQLGLRHPRVVRGALSLLEARPRMAEVLVAVTGDYVPLRELLRPSVWSEAFARPRQPSCAR